MVLNLVQWHEPIFAILSLRLLPLSGACSKSRLLVCPRPSYSVKIRPQHCELYSTKTNETSCNPLQVDNIFIFIRQVAPIPACWLFKTSATFWPWNWCPSHVWRGLPLYVPILVFLCLSVLELGPMYATDRRTSERQTSDKSIA